MDKSVAARRKAQQLAREGHVGRAIQEMDRILVAGEADPYDFVFHGDMLVRERRLEDAVASYDEAVSAYERVGLYRNAIAIAKKILRWEPNRARTHWRLGDLYAKEGLIGDAVSHFLTFLDHAGGEATGEEFLETLERIAGLCGPKVELALRLSELYVRAGRSDRAANLLDQVAEQAADGGGQEIAQNLREKCAQLRKSFQEESVLAAAAAELSPAPAADLEAGISFPYAIEPESSEEMGRRASIEAAGDGQSAEPSSEQGCLAQEPALPLMGRTIALEPQPIAPLPPPEVAAEATAAETPEVDRTDRFDPRREAIEAAIHDGDWSQAVALAEELRDESPEDPWPIEKLIAVSRQLGDTLATIRHLTLLGDLLITQEDLEGSLTCFREVLVLDAENGTARRRLARFREMKVPGAEEVPEEGSFPIRRAIETQGATVSVRENGGVESQEWIDLAALLDEFREGVRAQYRPEDYAGHYDLGVSHMEMGLYEEAIEEFDLVLSISGLSSEMILKAREMRGNALQRLERFREAIHEYRLALEMEGLGDEVMKPAQYQLACALERAGDLEEARKIFRDLSQAEGEPLFDARERLEKLGG